MKYPNQICGLQEWVDKVEGKQRTSRPRRYSCSHHLTTTCNFTLHSVSPANTDTLMLSVLFQASSLLLALILASHASAIKFALPAHRYPPAKCIWNTAHPNSLVIVTANVAGGVKTGQRVDIEILDSSPQKNVYLSKKGIVGETRLAVTTHSDGEVGVCFRNYLDHGPSSAHF